MKKFLLEVITPERTVYKNEVEHLRIPAYNGNMGILRGHMDYLAEMVPGEIQAASDGVIDLLAISGGFAEIHNGNVVLLCETAEMAEDIDMERAYLERKRAQEKLKAAAPGTSSLETEISLKKAIARLKVVGNLRKLKKVQK